MLRHGNVVIFTTSEEKQEGLGRWASVPVGIYFLFPYSGYSRRFHSHNMREPIMLYELAHGLQLVQSTLLVPLRTLDLHPDTVHVVETALTTKRPSNFNFLKEYVR